MLAFHWTDWVKQPRQAVFAELTVLIEGTAVPLMVLKWSMANSCKGLPLYTGKIRLKEGNLHLTGRKSKRGLGNLTVDGRRMMKVLGRKERTFRQVVKDSGRVH